VKGAVKENENDGFENIGRETGRKNKQAKRVINKSKR